MLLLLAALVCLVLCFAAAWAAGVWHSFALWRAVPVSSCLDGTPYRVHLGHADPHAAADRLAAMNQLAASMLQRLLRYGGAFPQRQRLARNLRRRYSPASLAENSPHNPTGDTAYTVDKGVVVALCLRAKDSSLHDISLLSFVMLHELAHLGVEPTHHPPEFWAAFKTLLWEATQAGLTFPDYGRRPIVYCGLRVDYNPLYDPQVGLLQ